MVRTHTLGLSLRCVPRLWEICSVIFNQTRPFSTPRGVSPFMLLYIIIGNPYKEQDPVFLLVDNYHSSVTL